MARTCALPAAAGCPPESIPQRLCAGTPSSPAERQAKPTQGLAGSEADKFDSASKFDSGMGNDPGIPGMEEPILPRRPGPRGEEEEEGEICTQQGGDPCEHMQSTIKQVNKYALAPPGPEGWWRVAPASGWAHASCRLWLALVARRCVMGAPARATSLYLQRNNHRVTTSIQQGSLQLSLAAG